MKQCQFTQLLLLCFLMMLFYSCNQQTDKIANIPAINKDSILFAKSQKLVGDLFKSNCSNCHKTTREFTGPAGEGIMSRVSFVWYKNFVKSPANMWNIKDPYAVKLMDYWKPTLMTSFPMLSDSVLYYLYVYQNNGASVDSSQREHTFSDETITNLIAENQMVNNLELQKSVFEPKTKVSPIQKRTATRRTTNPKKDIKDSIGH
ncbi:MAG: hypothetical protein JSR97_00425 [Verrucomicrobia bacterium]|nr:hypothetical protein [Verrucomicrobiota bacterium]